MEFGGRILTTFLLKGDSRMGKARYFNKFVLIIIIMCLLVCLLLSFSSCGYMDDLKGHPEYFETDLFMCYTFYEGVCIAGLTDAAKELTEIVFPAEIDGKPVNKLGYDYGKNYMMSENLIKVFIPSSVEFSYEKVFYNSSIKKIIINTVSPPCRPRYYIFELPLFSETKFCIPFDEYVNNDKIYDNVSNVFPANISFMYNYPDAINGGYYWIDRVDNDRIKTIPENPTRVGYEFGGWYTETDGLIEWVYNDENLPSNRLTVYAKWIEK
ncbi:MAG: hypothetical protein EOM87_00970 [Clostridia bacterium]|nr:hypothetical protein [Clostridia bacterium]